VVTTIAICSQKGGVAKTTTCLSLGACLVEMGKSVLLIDLDPQAHLTLSTGIKPETLQRTVADALLANTSLVSVSRESSVLGLDIVPANQSLTLVDKLLYGHRGYEYHLKSRLQVMGDDYYDVVLIDCPPHIGTLTLNALTAAELMIIPVQCEYYAVRSLRRTINLAKLIRRKTNPCLHYQVLVTMFDRRNKICRLILDRMQHDLPQTIYDTIIEVDTKLRESPAYGQPITIYAPETRGVRQYRALAQEVLNNGRQGI
jgi:chromosome partitioning protein